jgi:general secretion pathway protein C
MPQLPSLEKVTSAHYAKIMHLAFAYDEKRLLQFLQMSILEKLQPMASKLKSSANRSLSTARPPLEKYYVYFLALFIGYVVSDLGLLYVRPNLLPTEAPPVKQMRSSSNRMANLADYDSITRRNIFNSDGVIPPALGATKDSGDDMMSRPAVLSQLPLQLLGTIVHYNPKLSVVTVNVSSKGMSMSYKVDEEIESLAKVTKIERKKVTFINLNNHRLEYIEIPEDAVMNFGLQNKSDTKVNGVVEQTGMFDFAVKRSDFDNITQNLSPILQQARMEPVFSPDGIGVEGFKFTAIQKNSIFEQLGFKEGDMIRSVNNEQINSPTKAMETFNLLRSSNAVSLGVERDGREQRFNYMIK